MAGEDQPGTGRSPVVAVVAGVAGSAALIAGITVVSRLVGFGRVFVFSGAVGGGGCLGTAYTAVNQVPNVLFEVAAGGALAGAVVPVIAGMLAQGRRADADRTASALLSWVLLVLAPLAFLLAVAARPLADALLQGSAGTTGTCAGGAAAGARMLIVFAPQVVLYGVGIVLTGVLQAHRRFAGPALAPMLSSVVVIVAYLAYGQLADGRQHDAGWFPPAGPELVLSGGTTLGVLALSLPLLVPLRRTGTRLRLTLRFPPGTAGRIRALALAGVGALLAQQVATVVSLTVASRVGGQGAPNVVQFAQTVYLLPYAVLAVPLATAAFPRLSAQAGDADPGPFAATAAATTRLVLLVSGLGAGLLVAVAPAVQGLFLTLDAVGGGPLTSLGDALVALAPGLVGWSLVAHLSRVLYARHRGRAAAVATASGWGVVVAASLAGVAGLTAAGVESGRAAVIGLGAGNSAGMLVAGTLLLAAVRRAAGPRALTGIGRALAAGAAGAVAGAVVGRRACRALAGTPDGGGLGGWLLAGAAGGLLAVAVFAAVAVLLDRSDLAGLLAPLRRRSAARDRSGGDRSGGDRSAGDRSGGDGAVAAAGPVAGEAQGVMAESGTAPGAEPAAGAAGAADGADAAGLRVLLVLATSAGGVGRHVRALAEGLAGRGAAVTVAGHPATEGSFRFTDVGAAFEPIEVGDAPRPGPDRRAVRRLRTLAAEAEVVHAHGLRAAALTVLATRGVGRGVTRAVLAGAVLGRGILGGAGRPPAAAPDAAARRPRVVVTLHNAPAAGRLSGRVSAVLERLVAWGADVVLVVSGDLGARMRRLGARTVQRALVPAPHRDPSGPPDQVRARVRADLGVRPDGVLLVTVARLAAQKGLAVLVEAVAALAAGRPAGAVTAVVAGDGPLAEQLRADLAARGDTVPLRLLGARDDVADLLAAADALVLSSLWEGQPLAVQEALRAGVPVVATDAGGTAEVTGDAALLVPAGDSEALAGALARLVDDAELRRDLARRALARAATLPGDGDAVDQVLDGYVAGPGVVPRAAGASG